MSFPSLAPIGGAALGVMAGRAMRGLANGLDFRSLLTPQPEETAVPPVESAPKIPLDEAVDKFTRRLSQRLLAKNIELSQPITLKLNGANTVVVDEDHPNRADIEDLFAEDPSLVEDFKALSTAATQHRMDPLGNLYANTLGEFRLTVGDGAASISFE